MMTAPTARSAVVGPAGNATTDPGNTETAVSSSDGNSYQSWRRAGCQDDFRRPRLPDESIL